MGTNWIDNVGSNSNPNLCVEIKEYFADRLVELTYTDPGYDEVMFSVMFHLDGGVDSVSVNFGMSEIQPLQNSFVAFLGWAQGLGMTAEQHLETMRYFNFAMKERIDEMTSSLFDETGWPPDNDCEIQRMIDESYDD